MKTNQSKSASREPGKKRSGTVKNLSARDVRAQKRREAIIAAALDEFIAKGFAATRLDDVAKRAGVAKGTIYLYFADKDALFQDLVRTALGPLIGRISSPPEPGGTARAMVERFVETFVRDIAGTKRGDILRLIISEGGRFPSLSEFYYREVVERGIAAMRHMIDYGIARGEIQTKQLSQFPQLVVAPAMMAIVWQGLFGGFAPLDALAMLQVHIDLIFGPRRPA
jgi:AcrR family transcriptional regulator